MLGHRGVIISRNDDGIVEFRLDEPDTRLVLRGTWLDPPNGILDGSAFAHHQGCPPMEYRAKGVVDYSGALVVFGYEPEINAACEQVGSKFELLRFTKTPVQEREKKKEKKTTKPKPEAKPQPKPKPKPRPQSQPQPAPRYDWRDQWRW